MNRNVAEIKEKFIEKARNLYGDRYDYSKVDYINTKTKVCVTCPKHGDFFVTPWAFLQGSYCPHCKTEEKKPFKNFSELKREKKYTTESYLKKVKEIYEDKYDYSKIVYVNYDTKVCITCPKHGDFWVLPHIFLKGRGCPQCNKEERGLTVVTSTEDFIRQAKLVHGDKYDYSKVAFNKLLEKVCIICPKHGEFRQTPYIHLKGHGCRKCGAMNRQSRIITTENFIEKAKSVHGDKYDYSKVEYKNNNTKVCIICPKHGEFWQTPESHLQGCGCPDCVGLKKWDTEKFIAKAKEVHGDKYDYSKTHYINKRTKVTITCPIHGDFIQCAHNHIQGQGCPECGKEKNKRLNSNGKSHEQFLLDIGEMYGDKYEIIGNYVNNKEKIEVFCHEKGPDGMEHGSFFIRPNDLLSGHGCRKCHHNTSQGETELLSFIKEHYSGTIITNDRKVLNGKEIDILLPDLSLGFEYDGVIWHSEKFRDKDELLNKTKSAETQNIRLIHIFDDEWSTKKEICKSRVLNYLGKSKRIYARKCQIEEVSNKEAKDFLDSNHIQGAINSSYNIALIYEGNIVSLMTFGKLRTNLSQKAEEGKYEMLRFCNLNNKTVIGGASKMLKYFIKTYSPKEIISYADRRWSNGHLYEALGFTFVHDTPLNYSYVSKTGFKRINRFNLRKDVLIRKYGCPIEKTEEEFCREMGYYRVYDCGSKKYILKLQE